MNKDQRLNKSVMITPPGTAIVKSGGEQVIYTGRSTPAASGEVLSAGREDADQQGTIPLTRDLIKEIAMDIGKEVVDYIERMYPQAVASTSSTFKLSLRNCIHNEIMAAIQVNDEVKIIERLEYRKKFRRHLKKLNKAKGIEEVLETIKESPKNPAEMW